MDVATGLVAWVASRGGVTHSRAARDAGFREHAMRTAVARGSLRRVRRSSLVSPDADVRLVRAAEVGGRVTCVSAAARRGLWTPRHTDVHVAVPPTASRVVRPGVVLHWSRGPAPVGGLETDDPILNTLSHVARCLPRVDALAVWESALRARLVTSEVLGRVRWTAVVERELAAVASCSSDSGLETIFLEIARSIGLTVRQQVLIDGHRVDALIGARLVVQLDGLAFHQASDRRRDLRHDARLILLGYTVLRFDLQQLLVDRKHVIETLRTAVAQCLHLIRPTPR